MTESTPIALPHPDPFNIQVVKHFTFNQTGNIMMASTDTQSDAIQQSVRDVFAEVSVFFAAMTKSISQTRNPDAPVGPDGQHPFYTLYNYDALGSIINGSGYFINVTRQDVTYESTSYAAEFSQELVQAVLGLGSGAGAMGFAAAMVASMGAEAVRIEAEQSEKKSKVANIVFVCEYLLGMPVTSAIVITVDLDQNQAAIKAGPCFKAQKQSTKLALHKDTYVFVTPALIRQYAEDLLTGMNDPNYQGLIMELQGLVERLPGINDVLLEAADGSLDPVPDNTICNSDKLLISGQYLGSTGSLSFANMKDSAGVTLTSSKWTSAGIQFSVSGVQSEFQSAIVVKLEDDVELATPSFEFKATRPTVELGPDQDTDPEPEPSRRRSTRGANSNDEE